MENVFSRDVYRRLYSSTSRVFPAASFTTTGVEVADVEYTAVP